MPQYIYLFATLLFSAALVKVITTDDKQRVYFPGPPADPVIGHVRFFPLEYQWKTFAEWGKKFGEIVYVHALGKPMVILNSATAARELLEKRGANNSDRPRLVFFEMMYWATTLVCLPYGERWRKQRKLIAQHFTPTAVIKFHPALEAECEAFLRRLRVEAAPGKLKTNIHRLFSSVLVMSTYGHPVKSANDPYVAMIEHGNELLIEYGNVGGMPVDFLPFLRHLPAWLPGMGFKRHAAKTRKVIEEMVNLPYNNIKRERANGTAKPSLVAFLQEEYEEKGVKDPKHEEDIKLIGGMVYSAGVETSESSLLTFFAMLSRHPEVVKHAQAEIDALTGGERLVTFAERDALPYIDCIIKETLRMNSPAPLGIPHASTKDDELDGKFIPAGSMIMPNIWHMMRDEKIFPKPDEFNPDRYMSKVKQQRENGVSQAAASTKSRVNNELDEASSDSVDDPTEIVFGFGRRVCPGRFFALDALWLAMANTLAVFDILPPLDPVTGKEDFSPIDFTSGVTIQPKPFECRIVVRSEKHLDLIH